MNVFETSDLYLLQYDIATRWFGLDTNGIGYALDPQPTMFRAGFSASADETSLAGARSYLGMERSPWLLTFTSSPDGPPYRWAVLFIFVDEVVGLTVQDGPYTRAGKRALRYRRATKVTSLGSPSEGPGFFLTGMPKDGALWRLSRQETDSFNQWVLTLSPVQLSVGCPHANFSKLKAPLLAQEVASQYDDMIRAISANAYRDVVTKAKNIVEAIVADKLGTVEMSRDLFANLTTIRGLMEANPQDGSSGWSYMEYHLMQKLRLLHGQTHPTGPVKVGRSLRPEFALSAVEDLVELLRIWNFADGEK